MNALLAVQSVGSDLASHIQDNNPDIDMSDTLSWFKNLVDSISSTIKKVATYASSSPTTANAQSASINAGYALGK
jgi:hypothetical protein